jgi:hypothetical protein
MSIIASFQSNDFKKVNPGTYVARCFSMIEIGTIETEFKGQKKKQKKVNLTFELPTELDVFDEAKGEQPYVVSKTYTLSMFKDANLRKDLEGWRGKGFTEKEAEGFDLTKLLGKPCLISIIHAPRKDDPSKTYVQISSISTLMKGQTCPKQINATRLLSYDAFNVEVFNSLSDYLKKMIESSDEYKAMKDPSLTHVDEPVDVTNEDDGLPF